MAEVHQFESLEEYAHPMKTQPDDAWPLRRLGDQMTASVEQALKGKPKEEINRSLRRADLDILMLFHLHQRINGEVSERERYFATYSLMLGKQLAALMREHIYNDHALWNRMMVGLRLPYPLEPQTAAAVDAAIQNYVMPWEVLDESDELAGWISDSFLAQGKTELPDGAYLLQHAYSGPSRRRTRRRYKSSFPIRKASKSSWQRRTTLTAWPTSATPSTTNAMKQ